MDIKDHARSLIAEGLFLQARSLFMEALPQASKDFEILLGIGITYFREGDYPEAVRWMTRAIDEDSDNAPGHFHLANALRAIMRLDEAILHYQYAVALQPKVFEVHLMLASTLMAQKQLEDAAYHFQYALKIKPDSVDCHANLAQIYELMHDQENARISAERALQLQSDHPGALMTLGKLGRREDRLIEAEACLRRVLSLTTDLSLLAMTNIELGHVMDRLEKYDDAFNCFISGNSYWAQAVSNVGFDRSQYQTYISNNSRWFSGVNKKQTANLHPPLARKEPVFFVGFPRSGTTLTEQILKQHPDVLTSNEAPFIQDAIEWYLKRNGKEISDYGFLLESSIECFAQIRDEYWRSVEVSEAAVKGKTFVDKLPLNIIHLGFINRIFPGARIVVAIRDPRDVCLSCFMQGFTPNPAMINFLTMESSVDFYARTMSLWLQYRSVLPLKYYQYRYEDLVDDFDATTHELFQFLELDYPENTAEYYRSARSRVINTPSYQEVTRPVYGHGKARWKNYRGYIEPFMQKLLPFIEEFDYSV